MQTQPVLLTIGFRRGEIPGQNLITRQYAYESVTLAKAAVERLLGPTHWEHHNGYQIVDLEQFNQDPLPWLENNHRVYVFRISLALAQFNQPLPFQKVPAPQEG